MDTIRKMKLRQVFDNAVELPASDRARFVVTECGDDAELRRAVEDLLDSHERAGEFLGDPTISPDRLFARTPGAVRLGRIGPYRVQRILGKGGYGTVYLAAREPAVGSEGTGPPVALKIINAGGVTDDSLARFDIERESLARLTHPHIARLIEVGMTDDGQPWFAAEYVNGLPITDFCRRNDLGLKERLLLFADLCDAIQYAHQNGIIHRDIKPSNVLVGFDGSRAVAKVIDFGIAKAIGAGAGDGATDPASPSTTMQFGPTGTPQYMSPEQLAVPKRPTDTRTDVYGLGLILYEMLTDSPAFDPHAFKRGGESNVRRLILEVDPPLPSRRAMETISTASAGLDPLTAASQAKVRAEALRGELDWIVAKAIEKDPDRRYATADALVGDVRNYLTDGSVTAGPPSAWYQVRKFIRRNRRVSITAAVIAAVFVLGFIGTFIGFYRANIAKDNALIAQSKEARQWEIADRERAAAQRSEAEAKAEAARLLAAQTFLFQLFSPGGVEDLPGALTPDVLDYVSTRAGDGSLDGHPEVEAPLRMSLGLAWLHLKGYRNAESQYVRAILLFRILEPGGGINTASCLNNLAASRCADNRYDGAEILLHESLAMYRKDNRLDGIHDAPVILLLGEVLDHGGRSTDAIKPLQLALKIYREESGPHDPMTIYTLRRLATATEHAGDQKLAEQYRREAAALQQQSARAPSDAPPGAVDPGESK